MLSRALPEAKRRAGPPRKHAALARSACFRRGRLGFALVANPRRKHGTRDDALPFLKSNSRPQWEARTVSCLFALTHPPRPSHAYPLPRSRQKPAEKKHAAHDQVGEHRQPRPEEPEVQSGHDAQRPELE